MESKGGNEWGSAGLRPAWLSLEVQSNCVHNTNQWLHHDVVGKSVTFSEQP